MTGTCRASAGGVASSLVGVAGVLVGVEGVLVGGAASKATPSGETRSVYLPLSDRRWESALG